MSSRRTDIVFSILADDAQGYRRWWWANYADHAKQEVLRGEWARALSQLTAMGLMKNDFELRSGLRRWKSEKGAACPPDPAAFVEFMRPHHSPVSVAGLKGLRDALGVR